MNLHFPIELKTLHLSNVELKTIPTALLSCPWMQVNQDDFYLNITDVASFSVKNGNNVQVYPHEKADLESVKLFLNGSVLGAVLHQRATLPFHGSCFELDEKGILLCGESGAGKSSITAAFCQDGAEFINDDIVELLLYTTIIPIKTRIKLWEDSLEKLKIKNTDFDKIRSDVEKFYLPVEKHYQKQQILHHIFILAKHSNDGFAAIELQGMEKFNALRKQIYREIYLKGMPETEKIYFKQLFLLAKTVRVTAITRPQKSDIEDTMEFIKRQLV
jgi:hypothetical protein